MQQLIKLSPSRAMLLFKTCMQEHTNTLAHTQIFVSTSHKDYAYPFTLPLQKHTVVRDVLLYIIISICLLL